MEGGKTQQMMDDVYISLISKLLNSVDQKRKERIVKRVYADTFSDSMALTANQLTLL